MELILTICCSIEAIIICLLIFLILRSNRRSASIISKAELIKKRHIDIEDIDTTGVSDNYFCNIVY